VRSGPDALPASATDRNSAVQASSDSGGLVVRELDPVTTEESVRAREGPSPLP
jgi:hypothetical protein